MVEHRKNQKTRMAVENTASKKEYKQSRQSEKVSNHLLTKVLITVILVAVAIVFIFASGAFVVTEIIVEKNETISEEQIISFSGIVKGTNVFAISKKVMKNKLKENSYIQDVKIKRVLPNKIKLIVEERKVEYVLQLANSYVHIDKKGYVLEISNNKPEVPIVLGLTTDLSNIKPNDRLEEADLNKMNNIAKIVQTASDNQIANLITKIDVSNEMDYTIYLDTEGKIAHLGDASELNTRFLYVKKLLEIRKGEAGEILVNGDLNSEYVYFKKSE